VQRRRKSGEMGAPMLPAFEISFALWGMIACAAVEAAQIFELLL
jgi:hypothetical protein